jgi:hypothetical protein
MAKERKRTTQDADDMIREYIEGDVERPEVKESFEDSQNIAEDHRAALSEDQLAGSVVMAGDVDAAWDQGDVGEEAVGGDNPTPDQDIVEKVGKGVGLTYEDTEPLQLDDKLEKRDDHRWELDPASAEDYQQRQEELRGSTKHRKNRG